MFSFESNSNYINWLDLKHITILFSIVVFICIALYFLLFAKSKKGILATKITLATILFVLEIGRIIWTVASNNYFNIPTNWWITINFESCTMMVWLNITLIVLSLILNKNNQLLSYLYNISFGIGLVGGIITFLYPAFINSSYSIFHFINLQSIITHIILIVLPLYFLKTKQFSLHLKNFWVIPFAYVCIGNISSMAGLISNWNFAFVFYCRPFIALNINIPFPYHILVIFISLSFVMLIVYSIADLYRCKKLNTKILKPTKFEYFSYIIIIIDATIHLLMLNSLRPLTKTLYGLLFLLPILISITLETIIYKKTNKKAHLNE